MTRYFYLLFAAISFVFCFLLFSTFQPQTFLNSSAELKTSHPAHKLSVDRAIDSIKQTAFFQQLPSVHKNMLLNLMKDQHQPKAYKLQSCWSPDTDEKTLQAFYKFNTPNQSTSLTTGSANNFTFEDNDRWSTTATNGGGLQQGDPTTLTWSFIPDGTRIDGFIGEPQGNSDLIAFLDGLYDNNSTGGNDLTQRAWFIFFQDIFDRWSALTGFSYVYEPNDDGAEMIDDRFTALPRGALGVRGDLRIGGHSIDGQNGSNTLAYNFFPNAGDMVIDTDNSGLFGNANNNSLLLRNTLSHEHGHGLGLGHSCPRVQTKLMEPFISSQFDGPQIDDILGANRGYGDNREPNDNTGTATNLGNLSDNVNVSTTDVSIDDNSDSDYFAITATSGGSISITLSPVGTTYLAGPQNADGSCSAGTNFSPQSQSNLTLELLAPNGTTIVTVNATGTGGSEIISNQNLTTGAGTYFIKVTGDANTVQLYELSTTVSYQAGGCPENLEITEATVPNGIYEASNTLNTQNNTSITIPNNGNVTFQAGATVILNPGFTATSGSTFIAKIGNCSSIVAAPQDKVIQFSSTESPINLTTSKFSKTVDNLTAFPNPFSSELSISLDLTKTSNVDIGIYDVTGKLEQVIGSNKNQAKGIYQYLLNTDQLQIGIHFIYLRTNQGVQMQKLIKTN